MFKGSGPNGYSAGDSSAYTGGKECHSFRVKKPGKYVWTVTYDPKPHSVYQSSFDKVITKVKKG